MLKVLIYQGNFHACNIIVLHSLCLSVCLSVCLFVCLSVYLSVCLSFSHIQLVWSSTFHVIIICLFLFMFIGTLIDSLFCGQYFAEHFPFHFHQIDFITVVADLKFQL